MNTIVLETVQWSSLPDVDDLEPIGAQDHAVLAEIAKVLRRHGQRCHVRLQTNPLWGEGGQLPAGGRRRDQERSGRHPVQRPHPSLYNDRWSRGWGVGHFIADIAEASSLAPRSCRR